MAKKEYTVVHKKSNVVTNGAPKLPSASTLEYGEIAVNYGVSGETLSIRNSSDQIATFPSRGIIEGMISSEGEKYLTTATTIPTTAAEVGAMATSERGNYLVTGTTLDNVADGATRKLSDYSTTAHTHTAAEVGAISTADTGNFLTTAATLDNVADGSTRKLSDYLTTATTIPNVDNYFDDVEYDSGTKRINFKHGETVKDYIDATDFIKDGMVDEVKIATPTGGTNSGVTCLVVTFNTDAGKEDIEIPISSIFNASNYLSTGATLDDVADGTTRKLANYSLTSHTHSEYSLTSHTHSNYATTDDTPLWVTYGTTSYSDIISAYNANRLILCEYGEHVYRCTGYDQQGDLIEFACINFGKSGGGSVMRFLYCAGPDSQSVGWSTGSTQYEVASNRVNSISSASTNTQYASAKAVYDSIKSRVQLLHNSDNGNENIHLYTDSPDDNYVDIDGNGLYAHSNGGGTTKYSEGRIVRGTSFPDGTDEDSFSYIIQLPTSGGTLALREDMDFTVLTYDVTDASAPTSQELANCYTDAIAVITGGGVPCLRLVESQDDDYAYIYYLDRDWSIVDSELYFSCRISEDTLVTLTIFHGGGVNVTETVYSLTGHTHSIYSTTGHTHSEYATTAHTHTAAEVGAMATSERSNYLATGSTLDDVADGTTRKLSNYSLTGHTHSEYATTADTANFITSADTEIVEIRLPSSYYLACSNSSGAALPSGTYNSIANILANGQTPIIIFEDQSLGASTPFYCGVDMRYDETVNFFAIPNDTDNIRYDRLTVLPNDNGTIKTYNLATHSQIPTEATISSSGFTKNGITGITYNGTAVTVTNGVAAITGSALPTVTSADNGKVMMVVNGAWALVTPTTVYTGSNTPQNSLGNDGDIYLQTE